MTTTPSKRMGRPKKTPKAGQRVSLGLSVTAEIKKRLDAAADRANRSQSQEAERRLEWSFTEESRLGGPQLIELVETIAKAMKSAGEMAGFMATHKVMSQGQWLAVPYARDHAIRAAIAILEHHRPPAEEIEVPDWSKTVVVGGDPKQSREMARKVFAELGDLIAARELRQTEEGK